MKSKSNHENFEFKRKIEIEKKNEFKKEIEIKTDFFFIPRCLQLSQIVQFKSQTRTIQLCNSIRTRDIYVTHFDYHYNW